MVFYIENGAGHSRNEDVCVSTPHGGSSKAVEKNPTQSRGISFSSRPDSFQKKIMTIVPQSHDLSQIAIYPIDL